jgi:hypothetical protein
MKYRVGQRVRMLHDSGEGVITQLLDRYHVEVDLGDDFPIEAHIDELIAIDRAETNYLGEGTVAQEEKKGTQNPTVLGSNMIELSLVVIPKDEDHYELFLINPEPVEMVYTCFSVSKNSYQGLRIGQLDSGEYQSLATYTRKELDGLKGFYFQVLSFRPGKGHPHAPFIRDLKWTRAHLQQPSQSVPALGTSGWVFNLREDPLAKEVAKIHESEFIRVRQVDVPVHRPEPEIDLHIEALVPKAYQLGPSEIVKIQQKRIDEALNDSLLNHYASMVLIHGVGEGKLRQMVQESLKKAKHVKSYGPADPKKYGNGATKVIFI